VRVLAGPGRGAAAAINLGVCAARHPIICQVDQDVIVNRGWLQHLLGRLTEADVAAAQGYYLTSRSAGILARITGYDLELRWARLCSHSVDQVCTGNTVYRSRALHEVGLFDEDLGYGYDNDMSYRLSAAGYRLVMCREATSRHCWRERLGSYLRQQYGLGYGRLDLIARHPHRVAGDQVSGARMILHVPAMLGVVLGLLLATLSAGLGLSWHWWLSAAGALLLVLGGERLVAGARAARRFHDPTALLLAPVHLLRDLAWVAALLVWTGRRLRRRPWQPSHSMARKRPGSGG
jgi:cellulose synthase/poly-beta-1,6-N-acetylglucosamine synthase-like glycosyltransferase